MCLTNPLVLPRLLPCPALPADKNNKREHRGFGFVTFETEAAIQRVVAHGPHQIRGSIVAIDSAVPRQVRSAEQCSAARNCQAAGVWLLCPYEQTVGSPPISQLP